MNYSCIECFFIVCCFISCFSFAQAATYKLPPNGKNLVGQIQTVNAEKEDTLLDLARLYGLGFNEIADANPKVDPWLPKAGEQIILPTQFILPDVPRKGIVVNLAEMRLYYFPETADGKVKEVITYPIGIGREGWETPIGEYRIKQKLEKPSWTMPSSVYQEKLANGTNPRRLVPPGPDNPLGEYAMQLDRDSLLIHGTNMPFSIGMRVSRGCLRLYPEDIEVLIKKVPKGTSVRIVEQPYKVSFEGGALFLESHKPIGLNHKLTGSNFTPIISSVIKSGVNNVSPGQWQDIARLASLRTGIPEMVFRKDDGEKNLLPVIALPVPFSVNAEADE